MTDSNNDSVTNTNTSTTEGDVTPHENLVFVDADEQTLVDWTQAPDNTTKIGDTPQLSLAEFLSRPVRLETYSWSLQTPIDDRINPWASLLNHETVISKLRNFALMRANLVLRFVINGSPFMYGRLMAAVIPYGAISVPYRTTEEYTGIPTVNLNEAMKNYCSQLQHGFLDPSTNTTLELKIPFISPKNWARLYDPNSPSSGVNDLVDFKYLPEVRLLELNPLRIANPAITFPTLNITMFAWLEDVELAVPTGSKLLLSEGEELDAAEGKPAISSIASAVSTALLSLSSIPVIGPFAMAGSIASGATASIAKLFGYSRPMLLANTERFCPEVFANTAATQGAFTGYKLATDPLQGLSVDPRITSSSPNDELSIQSIASRESFITAISWTEDNKRDSNSTIFLCEVNPLLYSVFQNAVFPDKHVMMPSPCAFAVTPFTYWRGDMTYRFQVVASQYHRGKVAIFYEPNTSASSDVTGDNIHFNSHLTTVLDLQDLDNFELVIPWYSPYPMLRVPALATNQLMCYYPFPMQANIPLDVNYGNSFSNGYFKIIIINELTSPTTPVAPIEINIYAKCDNLEVGFPRSINKIKMDERNIGAQSNPAPPLVSEGLEEVGFDDGSNGSPMIIGGSSKTNDNMKVVMGERVVSFRTLLKRFNGETRASFNSPAWPTKGPLNLEGPHYPTITYLNPSGFGNNAWVYDMPIYEYLKYAFIATRGGMRRNFRLLSPGGAYITAAIKTGYLDDLQLKFVGNSNDEDGWNATLTSTMGTSISSIPQNNGISFESPSYTPNRYAIGVANNNYIDDGAFMSPEQAGWRVTYTSTGTDHEIEYFIDTAVADDFSFSGWCGTPPRIAHFS